MKSKQQKPPNTVNSLSKVLDQSEQIKGVVDECAEELSSVNLALKDSLSIQDQKAAIENALEKSQEVESKVQEASDQLSVVNKSLEHEVRERECLGVRLTSPV